MQYRPTPTALVYSLIAFLWVVASDIFVHRVISAPYTVTTISIAKGLLFVASTALLIWLLLRRAEAGVIQARRAHDARKEAENRFRVLADSAPVLIWMAGIDAKCEYFNRAWLEFTGRSIEQELGDGWAKGVHPDDFQQCHDTYFNSFHSRQPFSMEYRLRRYDEQYRWLLGNGAPRFSDSGAFSGYIGSCVDITDLKEAQVKSNAVNLDLHGQVTAGLEQVRQGEARYRRIVENAQEGIWDTDENARTSFVNASMARMLGYSEQELFNTPVYDYCDPEWRVIVAAIIEHCRVGKIEQHEIQFRHKDGSAVWAIVDSTPVFENDDYRGATGIVTNITERKLAEERLQRYAAEMASLIENAPFGIARTTREGKFLLVNPAYVQMMGYDTTEELLAIPAAQLYANPSERESMLDNMSDAKRIRNLELEFVKKDKSIVTVRINGVRLGNGEFQTIVEDVTQTAKLEERVRLSAKLEAVGLLAGGIAHDFNNLLMVIISNLDLVSQDRTTSESVRRRLDDTLLASKRAANLTSQLLAFSRKQVLRPTKLNLSETVEQVTRMLERLIGENIHVRLECSPDLGTVEVDRGQIEQVIMNLGINSRDAMPHGGTLVIETANAPLDALYIQHHAEVVPGEYVMLAVSDTGRGMDSQTLARIFEPFFTTKGQGRGTGLGLATTYGIVKQSKGYIWAYSEPGIGTTFKIYLPRIDAAPDREKPELTGAVSHVGTGKILLVEDEPLIREVIAMHLKECGYEVLEAGCVSEAISLAMEHKVRAVLTDVVLPDGSGKEVANKVLHIFPGVPVAYMSGYTANAVVHNGVLDAGTHFLQKPFTRTQLLELFSKILST